MCTLVPQCVCVSFTVCLPIEVTFNLKHTVWAVCLLCLTTLTFSSTKNKIKQTLTHSSCCHSSPTSVLFLLFFLLSSSLFSTFYRKITLKEWRPLVNLLRPQRKHTNTKYQTLVWRSLTEKAFWFCRWRNSSDFSGTLLKSCDSSLAVCCEIQSPQFK